MAKTHISILGAGISGLTLSRALHHRGIPSTLYDKKPSSHRYSYAITLYPSAYRPLLPILGLDEKTFKARVAVDSATGQISGTPSSSPAEGGVERESFRAHRGRFEELLREGLDMHWDTDVTPVVQQPGGAVTLRLASGPSITSDILVGADGVHSPLRNALLPEVKPTVLPYIAFNGKRRIPRSVFDAVYAPALQGGNVLQLARKNALLHIHVNDLNPGSDVVSVSWIYSRRAQEAADPLYKPNRPNAGATDTPEEFFAEVQGLGELEGPFADVFDGEKLRGERILSWLMRTVRVPVEELRELGKKGVVLVGDAVHAEPIVGGGGANAAILDGVRLAEFIGEKGAEELESWCEAQTEGWEKGVQKSERQIRETHAKL